MSGEVVNDTSRIDGMIAILVIMVCAVLVMLPLGLFLGAMVSEGWAYALLGVLVVVAGSLLLKVMTVVDVFFYTAHFGNGPSGRGAFEAVMGTFMAVGAGVLGIKLARPSSANGAWTTSEDASENGER